MNPGTSRAGGLGFLPGVSVEPYCAVVWPGTTFLQLLVDKGTDGASGRLAADRALLPEGARVFYVLEGTRAAVGAWAETVRKRKQAHDEGRLLHLPPLPAVTTEALDFAMLFLYVSDDLEYKETVRSVPPFCAQAAGWVEMAAWHGWSDGSSHEDRKSVV